jgi:hypothetical protein
MGAPPRAGECVGLADVEIVLDIVVPDGRVPGDSQTAFRNAGHHGTILPRRLNMPATKTPTNSSEAVIFSRIFTGGDSGLTLEVARYILSVSFTDEDKARMHELAVKNREGKISPEELEELDGYIKAGDILALVKSKARMTLKKHQRR